MNTTVRILSVGAALVFLSGCGINSEPLVSTITPTSTSENKPVEVTDVRPIGTVAQIGKSVDMSNCKSLPKLYEDVANTKMPYKNQEFGIEMMVPYNELWGTDNYKIAPVELSTIESTGNAVVFGPLMIFGEGGCGFVRDYRMQVVTKRDKAGVIAALKANQSISDEESIVSFTEELIGDKQVMVYRYDGLCEQPYYEVKGPHYNYVLATFCSTNADDTENLIETIKSLKFI